MTSIHLRSPPKTMLSRPVKVSLRTLEAQLRKAGSSVNAVPALKRRRRRPSTAPQSLQDRLAWEQSMSASAGVFVPVVTLSEANRRDRWGKWERASKVKRSVEGQLMASTSRPKLPVLVTLTRYAPQLADSDNNVRALKAVQDAVAKWLGVDDGDRTKVRWRYPDQVEAPANCFGVRIEFQPLAKHHFSENA